MSKSAELFEEPPPYSPSASSQPGGLSSSATDFPVTALDPSFFSQTLRTHLSTLPNRIRATSARNQTAQIASDLATISLLVPHVERFLSSAAQKASSTTSASNPVLLGSLTLVPAPAVPLKAELGDLRERRREGEFIRIVRVEPHGAYFGREKESPATGDSKKQRSPTEPNRSPLAGEASGSLRAWDPSRDEYFDSWGRFGEDADPAPSSAHDDFSDQSNCSEEEHEARRLMWWNDEDTAKRLASYLQPAPIASKRLERKNVQKAVVEAKQEKKGWFAFGRAKKKETPKRAEEVVVVDEAPGVKEETVDMAVRAEELSFQQENEFGVYESISGWGVVVTVKIRMAA